MSDSRAEFEAWARSVMPHCDISKLATNAEVYSNIVLEARWTTWQAARKAALEEAAKVCEKVDDGMDGPWSAAAQWCAKDIRSLADRSLT